MRVERHPITDRASWLALRRQDVTASVAGALLGAHEYQTAYGLWALKSGRIEEDAEESPAMRRGRLLEPVAIELLREQRPEWAIERGAVYLRDPAARLGATPDAFARCPQRGLGVVQIKAVEAGVFRKKWRDAETGEVEPPLWIAVQAIVEAHLAGAAWAVVAPMVVGHGIDIEPIEVPIHAGVIERVRDAVRAFWQMVESGATPSPDYGRDAAVLAQLYARDDGERIDLSADNLLPALVDERAALSEQKSAAEKRLGEIRTEILAKLGTAAAATLADGRVITAKTVTRKPYQVAAATYRDIRVKQGAAAR